MTRRTTSAAFLLAATLTAPALAQVTAGSLLGSSAEVFLALDAGSGLIPTLSASVPVITDDASDAVNLASAAFPFLVDINRTSIDINIASIGFGSGFVFNGLVVDDLNFTDDPRRTLTGAVFNSVTNGGGVTNAQLRSTDNAVLLDLSGRSLNNTRFDIDLISRTDLRLVNSQPLAVSAFGQGVDDFFRIAETRLRPVRDDRSDGTVLFNTDAFPVVADFSGDGFTLSFTSIGFGVGLPFNGVVFEELAFADPNEVVTGMTLVGTTNITGFDDSRLALGADGRSVGVNLAGLSLTDARLTVVFQTAVIPEPATGLAVAGAVLVTLRRRRA